MSFRVVVMRDDYVCGTFDANEHAEAIDRQLLLVDIMDAIIQDKMHPVTRKPPLDPPRAYGPIVEKETPNFICGDCLLPMRVVVGDSGRHLWCNRCEPEYPREALGT